MLSVLLTILKVLGIIFLVLLGMLLLLTMLVLFVPVRYRIIIHRKADEETPVTVKIRAAWLFHILNAAFSYPEAAFLRIRVFCFTVFSSRSHGKRTAGRTEKAETVREHDPEEGKREEAAKERQGKNQEETKGRDQEQEAWKSKEETPPQNHEKKTEEKGKKNKLFEFLAKLWYVLKNIKYTILRICDKIKDIVRNIQYYLKIIQSETFRRAWEVCSGQVFSLLGSIFPRRVQGELLVGTGDPASTGQILAIYGILYPLSGNHIDIVPDFERQILECDLLIKGKITVCKALKTAWIIYFNKDLRRLIKLLKREAA